MKISDLSIGADCNLGRLQSGHQDVAADAAAAAVSDAEAPNSDDVYPRDSTQDDLPHLKFHQVLL